MSAQSSASGSGKTYGAYIVLSGDPPSRSADGVGLVIDNAGDDDATRLRLGALSALEPEARPGLRRILATDRAGAPDWLAGLDTLQTVAPSPLIPMIANLVEGLLEAGPGMHADDAPATIEAILLLIKAAWERPAEPLSIGAPADDFELQAATRLIEVRLLDPTLDAGVLMQALGLSRSSLYRAFQPVGGVNAWIRQRRLEHARDLLANRAGLRPTVAEVGQACGFASDSHFSRAFRKAFGHSPGARSEDAGSGGA